MNAAAQAFTAQVHQAVLAVVKIEQELNVLVERPISERCACYDAHVSQLKIDMQSASVAAEALIAKRNSAPWMGA